ncbi:starch synthase [Flavipsychrobacter stenotrophus]|uniref:starch synthase n=1 Tax=Flavipsychrobacter stenotrophus TaxID=2077091 RepID=A0A2S7SXL1_9BACT|nr:glycogen/starch synthase [Flavipsychrobacter stenotrophus]PQJ11325.1 starch synthase [Flavipsychrobacter stenotrophus]
MSADTKKRVLIIANELSPYTEFTDFAHILNKLAIKTFDSGLEIRVIMPRFGVINERRHRLHEVVRLSGINVIIDKDDYPLQIKVASLPNARLQVYFMDNEDYFKRKSVFRDDQDEFFDDNAERMIFFCKSALETVKKFGWPPHVIHCHGWMTSLAPLYLKTTYKKEPVFGYSKVIYTAQADQFAETLNPNFMKKAMISSEIKDKDFEAFKPGTNSALTIGGSRHADVVVIGSDTIGDNISDELKPSKTKKIVKYDEAWKEDVSSLLELYKSLTES